MKYEISDRMIKFYDRMIKFYDKVKEDRKAGLSEQEIADKHGVTILQFRKMCDMCKKVVRRERYGR